MTTTYTCTRCAGSGRLSIFSNVLGGTCFKCNGSGQQRHKPAPPTPKWAVFGHERATGECVRMYNVLAKSDKAAIAKAQQTYESASSLYRDSYSLAQAKAIKVEDMAKPDALTWSEAITPANT